VGSRHRSTTCMQLDTDSHCQMTGKYRLHAHVLCCAVLCPGA
jgi:hypothetical protein